MTVEGKEYSLIPLVLEGVQCVSNIIVIGHNTTIWQVCGSSSSPRMWFLITFFTLICTWSVGGQQWAREIIARVCCHRLDVDFTDNNIWMYWWNSYWTHSTCHWSSPIQVSSSHTKSFTIACVCSVSMQVYYTLRLVRGVSFYLCDSLYKLVQL